MQTTIVLLLIAVIIQVANASESSKNKHSNYLAKPLELTPYLEENRIQDARDDAQVHLDAFQNITSYSGFLTVSQENRSNLFFWFFPSEDNYSEDPVILWLQGGPGESSLIGLFDEHGPFIINEDGNVTLRELSWHKNHSVLYIDQPIGTGFSYTDYGDFDSDLSQITKHLYIALIQFFTLFSELQENDLFVAGETYAGKYIPALGYAIHQNNQNASLKINLQGLLIGNGLSDPVHQIKYADFLYQIGLIDLFQRDMMFYNSDEDYANAINEGDYYDANDMLNAIYDMYFGRLLDIKNSNNYIKDVAYGPVSWPNFLDQNEVRSAIHVGDEYYSWKNLFVYYPLYEDIGKSVAPFVEELLSYYKILIYNGQLDIVVSYTSTVNYIQSLNFSAAEEYKTAERSIWRVGNRVAGYVKTAGNLTEVMVRDAGFMVPADQPEFAFDLIYNFVRNKPIAKNLKH